MADVDVSPVYVALCKTASQFCFCLSPKHMSFKDSKMVATEMYYMDGTATAAEMQGGHA